MKGLIKDSVSICLVRKNVLLVKAGRKLFHVECENPLLSCQNCDVDAV